MLSQKEFVEGCYNWYREADLQPGNPEDGDWDEAHYPMPSCKGGTETILLLREHHAIQGVIKSEELQWKCIFNWEKKYLSGEYLELFNKWRSEGPKLLWANKTEEEKILWAEKCRASAVAQHARMTEAEKILRAEKIHESRNQLTEEEYTLLLEKGRENKKTLKVTRGGNKIIQANKCYETWKIKRKLRDEQEAQELLARWKEGCVRDCIL